MQDIKNITEVLKKHYTITEERLTILLDLIFNNTGLSYTKNELRIKDDTAILQFIKAIYPDRYEEELYELQNENHIPRID